MKLFYKESIFASALSVLGGAFIYEAAADFFSGELSGGLFIIILGLGFAMMFLGSFISNKKWWKEIEKADLVNSIKQDKNIAIEVYNKHPNKFTLKKIESLNPEAARSIQESVGSNK